MLNSLDRQDFFAGRVRRAAAGLGLALALSLLASPTFAAAAWITAKVTGTVILFQQGQWAELPVGSDVLADTPVRTLQSGRVELTSEEVTLSLGPDTAVQIEQSTGHLTRVTQFAGTVAVDARLGPGETCCCKPPA